MRRRVRRQLDVLRDIAGARSRASPSSLGFSGQLGGGVQLEPCVVLGFQNPTQQTRQRLTLAVAERAQELCAGLLGSSMKVHQLRLSFWGERDALAAAIVLVALAADQTAVFEMVDVADEMAAIAIEMVSELVLGERPEVREGSEHGEMWHAQIALGQRIGEQANTDPGDIAREIDRQRKQGGGTHLMVCHVAIVVQASPVISCQYVIISCRN
jgi:hypothetical protein